MDHLDRWPFHGDMSLIRGLALTTAMGAAVTGGALFAFSSFVMPALDRLPAAQAVAAMQAINVEAPRSLLMVPLVGSAIGGVAVAVAALLPAGSVFGVGPTGHRGWLIVGGVTAVLALAITAVYHVPHNDALARLDPGAPDAAREWARYAAGWVRWNHVRSAVALVAAAALVLGSRRGG
jgi:uncharacterized membrane protein